MTETTTTGAPEVHVGPHVEVPHGAVVAEACELPDPEPGWRDRWLALDAAAEAAIAEVLAGHPEPNEPATAREVVAGLTPGSHLVVSSSMPIRDVEWLLERDAAARRLEVSRRVELVESEAVPVAMTYGILRPLLMFGRAARQWAIERRRVVLLHELAHVKRADWPALLLAELSAALYWFHPLAWWLTRRVRRDAETACDDLVIASGTKPSVRNRLGGMLATARRWVSAWRKLARSAHSKSARLPSCEPL